MYIALGNTLTENYLMTSLNSNYRFKRNTIIRARIEAGLLTNTDLRISFFPAILNNLKEERKQHLIKRLTIITKEDALNEASDQIISTKFLKTTLLPMSL